MERKTMKTMNIYRSLFLLILINVTAVTYAQPDPGQRVSKEQMVARRLEKIDRAVKLNSDQKHKIQTILEEEMTAMEEKMIAHRKEGRYGNSEQMKSEIRAIRAVADAKIRAILTEKQSAAYEKFLIEEEQNRPAEGKRPKPSSD
jgi:hypothetical protein